ncbi:MAG: hypothetical protein KatS3mg031_2450 [Chitinophagales bacterium]|nr:MAG: hypothetical protein KatS3mg031_2450 [Chitinophagales bacterium]
MGQRKKVFWLMKKLLYAILWTGAGVLLTAILFWAIRYPILRAAGNYLICEDPLEHAPALFILSGDPWDRGNEAIRLYKSGYAEKIICTGENVPTLFKIAGIDYAESELTWMHLLASGVAAEDAELLCLGTSTREEAEHILHYCREHNVKKAIIVSSLFHTRRMRNTFRKVFQNTGIHLIIRGAPSSVYDENRWWEKEEGLIFVNNEYIKIIYYRLKGF